VQCAISAGGTSKDEHDVGTGKIDYLRAEHGDAVDVIAVVKHAIDPPAS